MDSYEAKKIALIGQKQTDGQEPIIMVQSFICIQNKIEIKIIR